MVVVKITNGATMRAVTTFRTRARALSSRVYRCDDLTGIRRRYLKIVTDQRRCATRFFIIYYLFSFSSFCGVTYARALPATMLTITPVEFTGQRQERK